MGSSHGLFLALLSQNAFLLLSQHSSHFPSACLAFALSANYSSNPASSGYFLICLAFSDHLNFCCTCLWIPHGLLDWDYFILWFILICRCTICMIFFHGTESILSRNRIPSLRVTIQSSGGHTESKVDLAEEGWRLVSESLRLRFSFRPKGSKYSGRETETAGRLAGEAERYSRCGVQAWKHRVRVLLFSC